MQQTTKEDMVCYLWGTQQVLGILQPQMNQLFYNCSRARDEAGIASFIQNKNRVLASGFILKDCLKIISCHVSR